MGRTWPTPVDPALVLRQIIGSTAAMKAGERRVGLRSSDGEHASQPFVVLRECSFTEWHAWLLTNLAPGDALTPGVLEKGRTPGMRFYEISTD